jgi:hypothetical protein
MSFYTWGGRTVLVTMLRALRAPIGMACVCLVSFNGALLAGQGNTVALPVESDFLKWALTQGGLTVVLLFTLWSYRRDLARVIREEEARTQVLTSIVEKSTAALVHMADEVNDCPFHSSKT